MISGGQGHTWFQSLKLSEEEFKDPKIIHNHFIKSMCTASTYWIHKDELLSDIHQTLSDTIDSLDVGLINLIDLCKYQECYTSLIRIQLLNHAVKHWSESREKANSHMPCH